MCGRTTCEKWCFWMGKVTKIALKLRGIRAIDLHRSIKPE